MLTMKAFYSITKTQPTNHGAVVRHDKLPMGFYKYKHYSTQLQVAQTQEFAKELVFVLKQAGRTKDQFNREDIYN